MAKRVVLAYSGGLDTSVAVTWLQEELGLEVVAVAVDVGQGGDFEVIRQRALGAGAVESIVIDARAEMANDYAAPAIAANARYEGKYPLVSALSRPVIVRHLVAEARRHGADAVAHGCTGKGNDQVRFEVGTRALAPDLEIFAPARRWGMSREDCVDYAAAHGIPIEATKEKMYSIDENLWGRAIECGAIEDPWAPPPADVYSLTKPRLHRAPRRRHRLRSRRPGHRRRSLPRPPRPHRRSRRPGRRLRLGPPRHGREPPGRHQEPGDLRVPGLPGPDPGPLRSGGHHPGARRGPREGPPGAPLGRARLRRPLVLAAEGGPRRLLRLHPAFGHRRGPPALCSRAPAPSRAAAARCRSTTTDWPPTTRPTPSTTRTPKASSVSGVSGVATWAARQGGPAGASHRRAAPVGESTLRDPLGRPAR